MKEVLITVQADDGASTCIWDNTWILDLIGLNSECTSVDTRMCLYIINWNHRDGSSGHLYLKAGVAVIPSDLGEPGSEHCIQTVWRWIFVFCLLMSNCLPSLRSSSSPPSSLLYTLFLPSPTFLVHRVQRTQLISFQKLNQLCGDETTCFSAVGQILHVIVFRGQNLLSRCCSNVSN